MDDYTLQCYLALCAQLNFTNAAQTMYISQSTMTRVIANLETEVGCRLINRGSSGITLTLAGKEFLKGAKGILRAKQNIIARAQAAANQTVEEVKVGYMAQVSYVLMPEALKEAKRTLPDIKLTLAPNQHYALIQDLANDNIDIAILSAFQLPSAEFKGSSLHKDWRSEVLFKTPIILAIHEEHPLSECSFLTPETLRKERLIFYEPYDSILNRDHKTVSPIMAYLAECHDFVAQQYHTVGDLFSLLSLVECNDGIGVVPTDMIRFFSPHMKFLPIRFRDGGDCSLQCVICHKKQHTKPEIQKVVDLFVRLDKTGVVPDMPFEG